LTYLKSNISEEHISAPRGCCTPKISLKWNKGALITSELGGVARRNFGTWLGYRLGC